MTCMQCKQILKCTLLPLDQKKSTSVDNLVNQRSFGRDTFHVVVTAPTRIPTRYSSASFTNDLATILSSRCSHEDNARFPSDQLEHFLSPHIVRPKKNVALQIDVLQCSRVSMCCVLNSESVPYSPVYKSHPSIRRTPKKALIF